MSDIQQRVQQAIDQLIESGTERGLQVAVYRHGHMVVDAVAGIADPATERPVTSDTPFFSFSVGKGVAATVERNLPGWAGKGWYSLVGTTGFDMQRDRGAFDRHVKDLKALKLDPKPYRWRGAEVAAGE